MSRSMYARLHRRFQLPQDQKANTALSRREFLRLSFAASAGFLLSSRLPALAAPLAARPNGRRVVVIGAGFAGLACAYELLSAGYDVTVLEARPRIGGRVLSFRDFVPGKTVEGGGELIGSNHPTWIAYAHRFGLRFLDVTEDESLDEPVIIGGKRLSPTQVEVLYAEMSHAYDQMTTAARPINADRPWGSPHAALLDRRTTASWIAGLKVSPLCKLALETELTANNGMSTAHQSYLGNLTQVKGGGLEKYWTASEVYRCQGGNQQLAAKLAQGIGASRLHLQTPVLSIKVQARGVEVRTEGVGTIEAEEVVLAVPPGVWHKIAIIPSLPRSLQPQMGISVKYLMAFKNRAWKTASLAPDSLSDGPIAMTWESTDNQKPMPTKPPAPGHDVNNDGVALTAFSSGPAASRCRSRPCKERDEFYAAHLNQLYPHLSEHIVVSRFMDWPSDPWAGGGYSFPAPGQVTTVGPTLHQGLGRLHFAGEHTCYQFVGYMEGALHSGVALAKRLAVRDGVFKSF